MLKSYGKKILKNGLILLTVPIETAASVTISFFVKAGSRYEDKRINGLSHFLEHLHFKGSKKYPTAKKLSETVDSIGGEFNANTGKEHTQYYIRAASQHLPLIFDVLSDMMQNPLFDERELEREKGVIIEEINMYKDNPQIHVESLFEQTMWPNSALGRDIAGTAEVIRSIKRQDILDYRQRFYQPANMIAAMSGNFDQALTAKMIEAHWDKLLTKKGFTFEKLQSKQTAPALSVENKGTEQAHMIVGFPAYGYGDKRNYALQILAAILGGGMSSRLFLKIRERQGLAYYVACSLNNYLGTGNFLVRAGLKVSAAPKALDMILEELQLVVENGVTKKELAKAKEYLKGKLALSTEDPHEKMDWYLGQEAFIGKIKMIEEVFALLDAVTSEDVDRVAKEIIHNNRLNLALIGPFSDKSIFEKKLKL
ncbi:MAG: hypothetical protein A2660_00240 [Candidatus Doudnabacteria bacterium RIFCSPHIGHO2_01_FULL_45_18]|uniref:Peptidase M16 n=1 Tax=Candidatus Doudnabacteria bacterium RIFCSPHIGHO2_01_FULL_45_18 TaxID=1817823 RepID=A0A1F5NSH1_9BACT|nr:MAG: hypothetical protein A2660_00240 [Candidatus Doudnabacteria bacterium RIFCSPHIGHO2_01_FULL_45_18]